MNTGPLLNGGVLNTGRRGGPGRQHDPAGSGRDFRRQTAVGLLGWSVPAVGASLIVLPGSAILVIPLGLAILATELAWAANLFHHQKARVSQMRREGARRAGAIGRVLAGRRRV